MLRHGVDAVGMLLCEPVSEACPTRLCKAQTNVEQLLSTDWVLGHPNPRPNCRT